VTGQRPPSVGDTVYDTGTQSWAVITDIRQDGLPRPVFVLRFRYGSAPQWETNDPARLRTDKPR
jgi:hypothetical protein